MGILDTLGSGKGVLRGSRVRITVPEQEIISHSDLN